MALQQVPSDLAHAAPLPWSFPSFTAPYSSGPTDPRRRSSDVSHSLQLVPANESSPHRLEAPPEQSNATNTSAMQQLPPSADWGKMQERIGNLRVALSTATAVSDDLRHQVAGLMASLQEKHAENSYLQAEHSRAADQVQMLLGQLQGREQHAEASIMGRLQSELGESLRQRIELEAAVQQLQFELHAASAHAAAELSAERDERLRGASELGQVRLLLAARQRHLDMLQKQLDAANTAAAHTAERHQQEQAAADAARAVAEDAARKAAGDAEAAAARAAALEARVSELDRALEARGVELRAAEQRMLELQVQREWLEAAVSDLGQGHLDAAALLKMQEDIKQSAAAVQAAQQECLHWRERALRAEANNTHHPPTDTHTAHDTHAADTQTTKTTIDSETIADLQQQLDSALTQLAELQAEHQRLQGRWQAQGHTGLDTNTREQLRADGSSQSRNSVHAVESTPRNKWAEALGCASDEDDNTPSPVPTHAHTHGPTHAPHTHGHTHAHAHCAGNSAEHVTDTASQGHPSEQQVGVQRADVCDGCAQTDMSATDLVSPGRLRTHSALLQAAHEEIAQLRESNAHLTQQIADSKKGMVCMSDVVTALEQARTLSRAKLEHALGASGNLWAERVAELTSKLQEAQDAREHAERDLQQATDALKRAQSELQAAELRMSDARTQAAHDKDEALRQAREEHESELAAALLDSGAQSRAQIRRLEKQLADRAAAADALARDLRDAQAAAAAVAADLAAAQLRCSQLEGQLAAATAATAAAAAAAAAVTASRDAVTQTLEHQQPATAEQASQTDAAAAATASGASAAADNTAPGSQAAQGSMTQLLTFTQPGPITCEASVQTAVCLATHSQAGWLFVATGCQTEAVGVCAAGTQTDAWPVAPALCDACTGEDSGYLCSVNVAQTQTEQSPLAAGTWAAHTQTDVVTLPATTTTTTTTASASVQTDSPARATLCDAGTGSDAPVGNSGRYGDQGLAVSVATQTVSEDQGWPQVSGGSQQGAQGVHEGPSQQRATGSVPQGHQSVSKQPSGSVSNGHQGVARGAHETAQAQGGLGGVLQHAAGGVLHGHQGVSIRAPHEHQVTNAQGVSGPSQHSAGSLLRPAAIVHGHQVASLKAPHEQKHGTDSVPRPAADTTAAQIRKLQGLRESLRRSLSAGPAAAAGAAAAAGTDAAAAAVAQPAQTPAAATAHTQAALTTAPASRPAAPRDTGLRGRPALADATNTTADASTATTTTHHSYTSHGPHKQHAISSQPPYPHKHTSHTTTAFTRQQDDTEPQQGSGYVGIGPENNGHSVGGVAEKHDMSAGLGPHNSVGGAIQGYKGDYSDIDALFGTPDGAKSRQGTGLGGSVGVGVGAVSPAEPQLPQLTHTQSPDLPTPSSTAVTAAESARCDAPLEPHPIAWLTAQPTRAAPAAAVGTRPTAAVATIGAAQIGARGRLTRHAPASGAVWHTHRLSGEYHVEQGGSGDNTMETIVAPLRPLIPLAPLAGPSTAPRTTAHDTRTGPHPTTHPTNIPATDAAAATPYTSNADAQHRRRAHRHTHSAGHGGDAGAGVYVDGNGVADNRPVGTGQQDGGDNDHGADAAMGHRVKHSAGPAANVHAHGGDNDYAADTAIEVFVRETLKSLSMSRLHVERSHAQEAAAGRAARAATPALPQAAATQLAVLPAAETQPAAGGDASCVGTRRKRSQRDGQGVGVAVGVAYHDSNCVGMGMGTNHVMQQQLTNPQYANPYHTSYQGTGIVPPSRSGRESHVSSDPTAASSSALPLSALLEPLDILRASAGRDQARVAGLHEGRPTTTTTTQLTHHTSHPRLPSRRTTHEQVLATNEVREAHVAYRDTHGARRGTRESRATDTSRGAAGPTIVGTTTAKTEARRLTESSERVSSGVVSISLQDLSRLKVLGDVEGGLVQGRSRSVNRRYQRTDV